MANRVYQAVLSARVNWRRMAELDLHEGRQGTHT